MNYLDGESRLAEECRPPEVKFDDLVFGYCGHDDVDGVFRHEVIDAGTSSKVEKNLRCLASVGINAPMYWTYPQDTLRSHVKKGHSS